jgi:small subunit ribosomal protein S13
MKKLYGYNPNTNQILKKIFAINYRKHILEKTYDGKNFEKIISFIEKTGLNTGQNLIKKKITNIKKKINIKNFCGIRNQLKYPCRGQRTHTNAKTKRKFKI